MGIEPGKLGVTAVPLPCGFGLQSDGPLDHQASAGLVVCHLEWHAPPEPPAALRAPLWFFADTPSLAGPGGPGSLAGYERLAVACAVLADSTGHSPGQGPVG